MSCYAQIILQRWFSCLIASFLCVGTSHAEGSVISPLERPAITLVGNRAQRVVLQAITVVDQQLLAVGERGIVLISEDNGINWRQGRVPVSVALTAISMLTSKFGWAVGHGGVVLRTEDGGQNWSRQFDGLAAIRVLQEAAAAATDLVVREHRLALAQRVAEEGADKPLFAVHAIDERNVIVVGAFNTAFVSHDGGGQWLPLAEQLPNPREGHLYAAVGSGQRLYIAGEFGLLLRSKDGGRSFERLTMPYDGSLFALADNGQRLVVGGLRGNAFVSDDGGRDWQPVLGLGQATITAVRVEPGGGFLIGDQAGALWRLAVRAREAERMQAPSLPPVTDVVQASDGSIVVGSLAGLIRLDRVAGEGEK